MQNTTLNFLLSQRDTPRLPDRVASCAGVRYERWWIVRNGAPPSFKYSFMIYYKMFFQVTNLFERYGVVPQAIFPKSFASSASRRMDTLRKRLHEHGLDLRRLHSVSLFPRFRRCTMKQQHGTARMPPQENGRLYAGNMQYPHRLSRYPPAL